MQVCDKLQASPYVVKRTTGLPSGALASPCYMNTSQQKTGPPSLCMAGIAKGPEGASQHCSTPGAHTQPQHLCSCLFLLTAAGCLLLLLLHWQGRQAKSSREGTEQFFSKMQSLSTSESLGTTPQHKCIPVIMCV